MKSIIAKNIILMLSVVTLFSCNNNGGKKATVRTKNTSGNTAQTQTPEDSKINSTDLTLISSSDRTVVSSQDHSKIISTDASIVSSKDSTQAAQKASGDSTLVPAGKPQVAQSQDHTVPAKPVVAAKPTQPAAPAAQPAVQAGAAAQKPAEKPAAEAAVAEMPADLVKNNLKMTDIKILDESLLKALDATDFRMLFENYLAVELRAQQMIEKRKFGVACKFDLKGELKKGQVLAYKKITASTKDKTKMMAVHFADAQTSLTMNCQYDGDFDQKYFADNFYDVVDFKTADGQFKSDTEKRLTYEQIVEKTKTMKVLNSETLLKAHVNASETQEKFGIIAGQLVDETDSIIKVQMGRAKQACAVIGIKGDLKNGRIYKQVAVRPDKEDKDNNFATMQIYYAAADGNELALECALRRNGVGPEIIFETFQGLLEYGAK